MIEVSNATISNTEKSVHCRFVCLYTLSGSNYLATVTEDDCISCANCEERCPVEAVKIGQTCAEVDSTSCMGCGVCVPTCDGNALSLIKRAKINPPLQPLDFMQARFKGL